VEEEVEVSILVVQLELLLVEQEVVEMVLIILL
jgi:hypothetical protein